METRGSWHALQARLDEARKLFAAGERLKALEAIDAALEIDPNFLGAQLFRDRMLRGQAQIPPGPPPPPAFHASTEEFVQFEQRAIRRRTERRLEAARAALAARREREARQAIEELSDLDPDLPGLRELTLQADDLRRSNLRPRMARWLVGAAACFAVTFATLSFERSKSLSRRARPVDDRTTSTSARSAADAPAAPPSPLAQAPESAVPVIAAADGHQIPPVIATGGPGLNAQPREAAVSGRRAREGRRGEVTPATRPSSIEPASATARPISTPPPSKPIEPSSPLSTGVPATDVSSAPGAVPAPVSIPRDDDSALVQTALQRYRRAYDRLDAHSAAAVWPAVNETALARAFDGLASQALVFDVCYVKLDGDAAAATCRGSARYVPKVGSREARVEPRLWNFTLRKAGSDWRIENARAER